MSWRRGDLVTVAAKGHYTGKPRPALVVQATETLPYRDSVTVCLLTADVIEASLLSKPFGRLSGADLERVDAALRFWLAL